MSYRRPSTRYLGQEPTPESRRTSPWVGAAALGAVLLFGFAGVTYLAKRTSDIRSSSQRLRRWG